MLIYGLKNCDKCRAARKVLQSAEFVDIREVPLSVTALAKLIETYGDAIVISGGIPPFCNSRIT